MITLSAPAMEALYHQLDSPSATVFLADSKGAVLRTVGARPKPSPLPVVTGTLESAPRQPGNALSSPDHEAPNHRVPPRSIGIAVPVLPPDCGLLGLIDSGASLRGELTHANALVQTTAHLIEHRLIETDPQGFLLLRFHRYPAVLGSPLEAIALFDVNGVLLAANHLALKLLPACPEGAPVQAPACFATQWRGIVGYAALGLNQPFTLRDRCGTDYSARASLKRTQRDE